MIIKTEAQVKKLEKELQKAGFKEFEPSGLNSANQAFQKCYYDGHIKKYFLTIYKYDFRKYRPDEHVGYQCEVQLYRRGDHAFINLVFTLDDWKLKEIEDFVEELYQAKMEAYEDGE